jgi:hypothetical protein
MVSIPFTSSVPWLGKFRFYFTDFQIAVWGNGPRAPGSTRSGGTPGASTWIESRTDGFDWALTVNTNDFPDGETDFANVMQAIDSWLNTNP